MILSKSCVLLLILITLVGCTSKDQSPSLGSFYKDVKGNIGRAKNPELTKLPAHDLNRLLLGTILAGDEPATRELLQAGANPNANYAPAGEPPITPLIAAVAKDQQGISQLLITYGADPWVTHRGYSVYDFAVYKEEKFSRDFRERLREKN